MKILCVSDTHLENVIFDTITKKYPDMDYYIHCGDSSLTIGDPLLTKYLVVKGNHDDADFLEEIILTIGDKKCMIVHGNHHQVYLGYEYLLSYMEEKNIDICFHGHTHIPTLYKKNQKTIINPGSVMINRASYGYGTYAIVEIIEDTISVHFYHHITHEECTSYVLLEGQEMLKKFQEILK